MEIEFAATGSKEELIAQIEERFNKEVEKWEPSFMAYFMKIMALGKRINFTSFEIVDNSAELSITGRLRSSNGYVLRVTLYKLDYSVSAYYYKNVDDTLVDLPQFDHTLPLRDAIPVLGNVLDSLRLNSESAEYEDATDVPAVAEDPNIGQAHPGDGVYYVGRNGNPTWMKSIKIEGDKVFWYDINVNGYPLRVNELLKDWKILGRKH